MKTLRMHFVIAVAALAVAAGSASAQTYKAQVPMAFHAGNKTMSAGSYEFRVVNTGIGQPQISVRNLNTSRAAILLALPGKDAPKAWREQGKPVISFDCLGSTCALGKLWNGEATSTYTFAEPRLRPTETERIASVTVALTRGE